MDASKPQLIEPESRSLQQQSSTVDLHHMANIKHRFPAHLLPSSSTILSTPALVQSLPDVNTKHLTEILCSASMDTDQHSTEAALSASEGLVRSPAMLPQTYISQSYIPVTTDHQVTMATVSDLELSGSAVSCSSLPDSSHVGVPTEDSSATLHTLFSSFSQLQQLFAKNPQLLIKSSTPMQTSVTQDSKQKVLSSDSSQVDLTEYYAKRDSEQVESPIAAAHVPLIQVPNPALYRYSELTPTIRKLNDDDSVGGAVTVAATVPYSYEPVSPVPPHSVRIHPVPDTLVELDNSESVSQQHLIDNPLVLKQEKLSMVEQTNAAAEMQYSQDQLKGYYHSMLMNPVPRGSPTHYGSTLDNPVETKPVCSKWAYSDPAMVGHQTISKNIEHVPEVDMHDIPISSPTLSSQPPCVESTVESVHSVPEQSVSEDCICDQLQTADDEKRTKTQKTSRLKKKHVFKNFTCGGCSSKFSTLCRLHVHLKDHASGGSYHFDHVSQTAFPKYDTFCSYAQTDFVEEASNIHRKEDIVEEPVEQDKEMSDIDRNKENVVTTTRRASRKQEELEGGTEAAKPATRSQNRGGRKRKQDNPKPTKPRMYVVPIAQKGKKPVREKRGKGKGRGRKLEQTLCDAPADEAVVAAEQGVTEKNTDMPAGKDQAITVYIDNPVDNDYSGNVPAEDEILVIANAQPSDNTAEDDSSAMSKPFKKRGRSRKPICDLSKITNVKEANKKVTAPVTRPKRTRKRTDTDEQPKPNTNTDKQTNLPSNTDLPLTEDFYPSSNNEDSPKTNDSDYQEDGEEKDSLTATNPKRKRGPAPRQDATQICDTCGQGVPRSKFVFHARSHTGERPYVCEKCGKAFARARFLTKHLVTHSDVKPWRCDLCPAQFCQKNEYNMHKRGHAGDRPYQCNICEIRFLSKTSLHTHQANIHMGLTRFECDVCKRRFFKSSSLTCDRPYQCNICEIRFLSKTSLHTHQANIHMGLTRFECDVCKRRFFKRSSLTCHQATHFEATLKCGFCDRKFRDKTGLKRHEKIHTGVKKFKCHICEHAFIQSTPYWTHMEKRHSLSKVKVKEMLKTVKETNRRSGIQMDINVLPADVDNKALVKQDTEEEKEIKRKAMEELKEGLALKPLPKFHQLTKPYDAGTPAMDDVFSEPMDTTMMLRHYIPITTMSQGGILGLSIDSSAVSSLPGMGGVGGVTNVLQPSMTSAVPVAGSLQIHGLIGINNLQQAQDVATLPQAASYTDISRDRVITEADP